MPRWRLATRLLSPATPSVAPERERFDLGLPKGTRGWAPQGMGAVVRKAFRQLRQLDASLQGEHQECACAVAYAAAALLWFPEELPVRVSEGVWMAQESPKLARAVTSRLKMP